MTFWQWLDGNWVKTVSSIGALNSALIAATAGGMFTGLIEDATIKWLAILGFFMNAFLVSVGNRNTTQEKVADAKVEVARAMETAISSTPGTPPRQGGFAVLSFLKLVACLFLLFVAIGAPIVMQGCVATREAYSVARESKDLGNMAYVVTEHYAAVLKEAADLRQTPGTPQRAIDAMRAADLAVRPFIVGDPAREIPGLDDLARDYQAIRSAKTEADLQAAINNAVRELTNFSKAVKAARGTP